MDDLAPQIDSQRPVDRSTATATAMRFVLLGDVHVYRLAMAPWHLLSKRILGQMNLWFNRRSHLRTELLPRVVERIASLEPDMILCTGDLTTTALPAEFALARQVLSRLFDQFDTFIVPGNHDRYTFTAARTKRFEQHFDKHTSRTWPCHRKLADRLHLVAFDPTRPTFVFAGGVLDDRQLRAFTETIRPQLHDDDRLIVMSHYPIGTPANENAEARSHALRNADRLVDALRLPNPVLYLHGHVHRPWCWRCGAAANITIVNAGAPVQVGSRYPLGQGFWEIAIDTAAEQPWQVIHHRMDGGGEWHGDHVPIPSAAGGTSTVP